MVEDKRGVIYSPKRIEQLPLLNIPQGDLTRDERDTSDEQRDQPEEEDLARAYSQGQGGLFSGSSLTARQYELPYR